MGDRERKALREWREQLEAEENAAREAQAKAEEERLRPIRLAEEQLAATHGQLLKIEREKVLHSKDDTFRVDDAVRDARMSLEQAEKYNQQQARLFAQNTPDYYRSDYNAELIKGFMERNFVMIANAATFKAAYERLLSLGLLEGAPEQPEHYEPEPPEQIPPPPPPGVPSPTIPKLYEGYDPNTGEPLTLTEYQANKLSAEEWRRFMKIPKVTKPGEMSW